MRIFNKTARTALGAFLVASTIIGCSGKSSTSQSTTTTVQETSTPYNGQMLVSPTPTTESETETPAAEQTQAAQSSTSLDYGTANMMISDAYSHVPPVTVALVLNKFSKNAGDEDLNNDPQLRPTQYWFDAGLVQKTKAGYQLTAAGHRAATGWVYAVEANDVEYAVPVGVCMLDAITSISETEDINHVNVTYEHHLELNDIGRGLVKYPARSWEYNLQTVEQEQGHHYVDNISLSRFSDGWQFDHGSAPICLHS